MEMDFSDAGGLVAITGPNGAGKTTLLDNLHPYRIMPYRASSYSARSFSFYSECYGRDASKEFVFELNGHRYKSLLLIDAERKKQEAYLYEELADHSLIPLCDGKVDTYDRLIEELLGSPQMFFTSVFRCQDAPKLSDYSKGEIKDIFTELLGIELLRERGMRAKELKDLLLKQMETFRLTKESLHADVDRAHQAEKEAKQLQNERKALAERIQETEKLINSKQVELQTIKAEIAVQETLQKEKQLLKGESKGLQEKLDKARKSARMAEEVRNSSKQEKQIGSELQRLRKEYSEIEHVISNIQKVFCNLKEAEKTIAEKQRALSELRLKREHEYASLKKKFEEAQNRTRLLKEVPCGSDLHEKCPLLKDAVQVKESLIRLVPPFHKLKEQSPEEAKLINEIEELKKEVNSMSSVQNHVDASNKKRDNLRLAIEDCERKIERARKLSIQLPEVEMAVKSIPELEENLRKIEQKLSFLKIDVELKKRETTLLNVLNQLQNERKAVAKSESEITQALGAAEALIKRGFEAEKNLKKLDQKINAITSDISDWSLLERAFSNDGIIALEIDDAGPTISAIANDLLQSCFGPRFSVRIDTQVARANGKGLKETFDIIIFDSERNESKSLRSMSGGEKVWCVLFFDNLCSNAQ
jgi:exonuclease SbcC